MIEFDGTTLRPVAFEESDPLSLIGNVCQALTAFSTYVIAEDGNLLESLSNAKEIPQLCRGIVTSVGESKASLSLR